MHIAVVHDWLDTWRGGENVLAEIIALYPDSDLFSLVDFLPDQYRARLGGKQARTTFLQHLPLARTRFRSYLPLMPRAIESLDLRSYDLVISSSHAVAKGAPTAPGQLHICYCHTPMRYAWDLREQYLEQAGVGRGWKGMLARRMLASLQRWDRATSSRVTHFVANSDYIRQRIARCYGRDATVIHPPVDVDFFTPDAQALPPRDREGYVTASRWVPYKRVDLIVAAFRELPDRRLTVIGDGPEAARIRALASGNVRFVGEVPREELRSYLREARAFLFAADEDFGILPVEVQACGTPVIAYGHGGALETVRAYGNHPGEQESVRQRVERSLCADAASSSDATSPTGVFFTEQTAGAIAEAIRRFDAVIDAVDVGACRANAERFAAPRFRREFADFVTTAVMQHGQGRAGAR